MNISNSNDQTLTFKIQPLLEISNGIVTGPMSPVEFAKEMCEQTDVKFNRLGRVHFEDEQIFQRDEFGERTGHDILLIAEVYANDMRLELWVDTGSQGIPVAMGYQSDREVIVTPLYDRVEFLRKITAEQIQQLFFSVFADSSQLERHRTTDEPKGN